VWPEAGMPDFLSRLPRIDREIWLLLGLSLFAAMPLAAPGYFLNAHDAPHTLFFLNAFDKTLRDGFLVPRWGTDFALGYGYPLFLFLSPLAYYVAEAFHLLGAGLTASVKLTFALSFFLSGLTMYALGRRLFGRAAGLLAGVLYVYIPYHLVDVYVRADLAEAFAYIFMPLTMLAFLRLVEERRRRDLAWAGLSYAGLLLAHNGTALLFTPVLMAYVIFLLLRQMRRAGWRGGLPGAWRALAGAALGAGMSAFFLLPAFLERQFIVEQQWIQGSFSYLKQFVYPAQLLSPFWGFGYAGEGLADEMSFQLGAIPLAFALAATLLPGGAPRRAGQRVFLVLVTLAAIFFMLPISAAVWRAIPLAPLVQFPWRLLLITSVTLALLGGSVVWMGNAPAGLPGPAEGLRQGQQGEPTASPADHECITNTRIAPPMASDSCIRGSNSWPALLALVVVLGSFAYTLPQYTEPSPRSEADVAVVEFELVYPPDRTGMMHWTKEQPMTSPLVPQYLAGEPLTKAHVLSGQAQVEMVRHGGASDEILVRAATPATVEFYTYYFPGWRARVDGQPVEIRPSGMFGLIALDVPAGEHRVALRFEDTPVRIVGGVVSVLVLLGVLALLIVSRTLGKGTRMNADERERGD